ncbi:MAG: hypothetical protein GY754_46385 [bacterium]|nr:hypothetical protein [bacterium]
MKYQKTKRFFETAGLVDPAVSYYTPLENVTNTKNQDIKTMIDLGRYFSIFAPRQSGKTTFFEEFSSELEKDSTYISILLSFQYSKNLAPPSFYESIQEKLYPQLIKRLEIVNCENIEAVKSFLDGHELVDFISFNKFFKELNRIIASKKIIIFIDEFDGIPIIELENFLNILRELYQEYKKEPKKALYSVALVGIRNIPKLVVGGVSPFNIADQVKLPPFSLNNIKDLTDQYRSETNQPFSDEAVEKIFSETSGQPWLINSLCCILTINIKPETTEPITADDVDKAIGFLLNENNNHFDNLIEKARLYKETFIQVVFNNKRYNPDDEDQSWLEQYGLIKEENGKAVVANPIYQKRFLNAFFREAESLSDTSQKGYFTDDGSLHMPAILSDFEEYIIQIGVNAFYKQQKPYEKVGQFLLTAWLYQFVKQGKGELRYETPSGLGRMDILLLYNGRKYIIEAKINRGNIETTINKGVAQLSDKYLSTESVHEGYLVVFDTKTVVGEMVEPVKFPVKDKEILCFSIGIGRVD